MIKTWDFLIKARLINDVLVRIFLQEIQKKLYGAEFNKPA